MDKKGDEIKSKVESSPVDSRIAAVHDLIFSENIQQYDSQFNEVNERIAELQAATEKNLAETNASLENKIADLQKLMESTFNALNQDIDKRLEKLDDKKADRKVLGKALEKIAVMLQQ